MPELFTLLDTNADLLAVDPVAFPDAPADLFWTSSPVDAATTDTRVVDLARGGAGTYGVPGPSGRVRCVR